MGGRGECRRLDLCVQVWCEEFGDLFKNLRFKGTTWEVIAPVHLRVPGSGDYMGGRRHRRGSLGSVVGGGDVQAWVTSEHRVVSMSGTDTRTQALTAETYMKGGWEARALGGDDCVLRNISDFQPKGVKGLAGGTRAGPPGGRGSRRSRGRSGASFDRPGEGHRRAAPGNPPSRPSTQSPGLCIGSKKWGWTKKIQTCAGSSAWIKLSRGGSGLDCRRQPESGPESSHSTLPTPSA